MYYYKSRYYNPILGRFIQPDTVVPDAKNLQAYNRYTYVNNNPLKYVDPSGHFWGIFGKIFAAFIGAFIAVITGFALAPLSIGIWASVIAGAVGGLVSGAITGGLKGALLGAAFGALGGAVFGGANIGLEKLGMTSQWGRFAVMSGVGAAISGGTGGWQGLVVFGAGLVGALSGMGISKAIAGGKTAQVEDADTGGPNQKEFDDVSKIIDENMSKEPSGVLHGNSGPTNKLGLSVEAGVTRGPLSLSTGDTGAKLSLGLPRNAGIDILKLNISLPTTPSGASLGTLSVGGVVPIYGPIGAPIVGNFTGSTLTSISVGVGINWGNPVIIQYTPNNWQFH